MKNQVQNENDIREYLMFLEFEMSDIDYDITFNIVDIDFFYETVTVAITDNNGRTTRIKQIFSKTCFTTVAYQVW